MSELVQREQRWLRRPQGPLKRRRHSMLLPVAAVALVKAAVMVGAPLALAFWVLSSPYFAIRTLEVDGGSRVAAGWMEETLAPLAGEHILRVSLEGVRQRLAAHPWVERVELRRELPDTLAVRVVERRPVALLATADGELYLDGAGRAIAPLEKHDAAEGLLTLSWAEGEPVPLEGALAVVAELARLEPRWGDGVGRVDILGAGDYRLHSDALAYPLVVRADTLADGIGHLDGVLEEIEARYTAVESIDLRFPRRIVIRPGVGEAGVPAVNEQVTEG